MKISEIHAMQIFDSRGKPTVKAYVTLENGQTGEASVPSGASTGKYEAYEMRDGGSEYGGDGVSKAVSHVEKEIAQVLCGTDADDIFYTDAAMIKKDGTYNKSALGANAVLAVSLAAARASAAAYRMPLYRYLGGAGARIMPVPMMNILNGGAHAGNNIDIQEFMIVPSGACCFTEAMKIGTEVYHALRELLKNEGYSVAVGDEGGFAPDLDSDERALEFLCSAVDEAGYRPGVDVFIALDAAVSDWYDGEKYTLPKRGKTLTGGELSQYFERLVHGYPVISIEDPLAETDFDGFAEITSRLAGTQIVGDDLFVTNKERLLEGIKKGAANAVLIKPNQIGSLSETLDTVLTAQCHGYAAVMSHRSGETEDTYIADIAVALGCGQIKTGAPCRSERAAKYNRLLEIEKKLGESAVYGRK